MFFRKNALHFRKKTADGKGCERDGTALRRQRTAFVGRAEGEGAKWGGESGEYLRYLGPRLRGRVGRRADGSIAKNAREGLGRREVHPLGALLAGIDRSLF